MFRLTYSTPRDLLDDHSPILALSRSLTEYVQAEDHFMTHFRLIGHGVYTIAEASRLSRVPTSRVKRWTRGYTYWYKGLDRFSPPPVLGLLETSEPVITFADLLEVRFLDAFRRHGVSWKTIRTASQRAKELLGRHHPFSTKIFKTDGRTILAEIVRESGDSCLLDLVKSQYEFEKIVSPFLYAGIEYNELSEPERWWPLGHDKRVVIDPARGMGAPIVPIEGVPTRVLFNASKSQQSVEFVAKWFEVEQQAVQDAVEFERSLTA
jgi:uncharacterized protein (DUF433 family)